MWSCIVHAYLEDVQLLYGSYPAFIHDSKPKGNWNSNSSKQEMNPDIEATVHFS